jgi:hypothetical protein
MKLIYQFLFIVVEKVYYTFYSRIMAVTRSDELCYSPAARGTISSPRVIARSLNNILFSPEFYQQYELGLPTTHASLLLSKIFSSAKTKFSH